MLRVSIDLIYHILILIYKALNDKIEIIYTLVSILHLTQKQTIDIKQDEIFGDIFIYLLNEKN